MYKWENTLIVIAVNLCLIAGILAYIALVGV
jgi:hypothetical protein